MLNRKGQSTLEYALIIAVVVGGLLLMQYYVKRGYAGRLKSASDEMGEQYDPTTYAGDFAITQHSKAQQEVKERASTTTQIDNQTNLKTGSETVGAWGESEDLFKK
jgi:uncharacterized protein (UPF0333 family)